MCVRERERERIFCVCVCVCVSRCRRLVVYSGFRILGEGVGGRGGNGGDGKGFFRIFPY